MIPRPDVLIGNYTHVGMERSANQDYYGYFEPESNEEFERLGRLIVVCDGMGGHAGGEVASQLATNAVIQVYQQEQSGNTLESLRTAVEHANRAVWDRAAADPAVKGMGTTVVAMVLRQGMAYFAHVGDSRAYLIRDGQLHAMTLDHSLVQQMVNEGLLREEDMESHPEKNVILRSMGVKPEVDVEISYQPYQVGDIYLLSTDGLTGLVSKEECLQIASHLRDQPMQASMQLVDLANRYGGYDNITVQMVTIRAMSPQEAERRGLASQGGGGAQAEVKLAPTQNEMAANEAAGGGGASVTGIVSAEDVARIKAQLQAQQASAAPRPAPRKTGGGMGTPVVAGVAVVAAAAGIFGGLQFAGPVVDARAQLTELRGQAHARLPDSALLQKADLAAKEAINKASGLLGAFTASGDLNKAIAQYKALLGSGGEGKRPDLANDLDAVRGRVLAAKREADADGVNASQHAGIAYRLAEEHLDKAKAAEKDDPSQAVQLMRLAEDKYKEARDQALDHIAKEDFKRHASTLEDRIAEAERVRASEHIGELLDEARTEHAAAQRLLSDGKPARAVERIQYAIFLAKAAARLAPEIEKKKIADARRRLDEAKGAAVAAGAERSNKAKPPYLLAEKMRDGAEAKIQSGDVKQGIDGLLAAANKFKEATSLAEEEVQALRQGAAEKARAAAGALRDDALRLSASTHAAALMQQGGEAYARGEVFFREGRFGDAASAFSDAERSFGEAKARSTAQVKAQQDRVAAERKQAEDARARAQAAKARADAAGAAQSAIAAYGQGVLEWTQADGLLQLGRFLEAAGGYDRSQTAFLEAAAAAEAARAATPPPTAAATPEQKAAGAAQQEMAAVKARAQSLPTPKQPYFTLAQRKEKAGQDAFDAGDYAKAKEQFLDAKKYYGIAAGE